MPTLTQSGLPASIHTEVTILGAMMLDAEARTEAIAKLQPWDFSLDSHQRIYKAIVQLHPGGVDYTTVRAELERRGEMENIGGPAYLAYLTEGVPRNINIESYVQIVKDKALLRELYSIHAEGQSDAADPAQDAQTLVERTQARLKELLDEQTADMQSVGQYLASQGEPHQMFERMATTDGLRLGWKGFDELTGGLQRGELLVLSGVASTGKTAWACNVAWNTSVIQQKVIAYLPFEQKNRSAVRRMLSAASGVDYMAIRDNNLTNHEKGILLHYREMLTQAPLYIDDTDDTSMTSIRRRCAGLKRKLKREGHPTGLDGIIIDQLSHVDTGDIAQKNMPEEQILGKQTLAAKKIAQALDVPVILLVQSTQESAKRTDPTPRMTDIAGSGKIKNHADLVAFVHRPEVFNKDDESLRGLGQMILAKNREGAAGTVDCTFQGKIMRWEDYGRQG